MMEMLEALPPPSAELIAMGMLVEAFLHTQSGRKRERFLESLLDTADRHEALGDIVRLRRSRGSAEEVRCARLGAVAWLRAFVEMVRRAPIR